MSDIVERLRDRDGKFASEYCKPHQLQMLRDRAADEIERLKSDLKEAHDAGLAAWAERDQYMQSNVTLVALLKRVRHSHWTVELVRKIDAALDGK